jgi:serine/threonine protein kinase
MCTCFAPRTAGEDDDPVAHKGSKVYVQDVSGMEPGSIHNSLRGFSSYSSQDYDPKPAGAETFAMAELARATANFSPSNKIGQGGFGMVYRGKLRDGRLVAIKRGKKDAFEQRLSVEFRTEVEMLSQVRVSLNLLGFSQLLTERCPRHDNILVVALEG